MTTPDTTSTETKTDAPEAVVDVEVQVDPDTSSSTDTDTQGKTYSEADVKALRSEAAGYRTKLRAAETARDEAKAALEAAKSEVSAASATASSSASEALRYRVALEKGVPAIFAERLIGSTREELEADAAALMANVPASPNQFSQGRGTPPPAQVSRSDAYRGLAGR